MSKGFFERLIRLKRILLFLSICLFLFIIYYDLTAGTLPYLSDNAVIEASSTTPQQEEKTILNYEEITVQPGDSLLAIIQEKEGRLPQSMETIIEDFIHLNGIKPEDIQSGKTYKIPIY